MLCCVDVLVGLGLLCMNFLVSIFLCEDLLCVQGLVTEHDITGGFVNVLLHERIKPMQCQRPSYIKTELAL